MMPIMNPAYPMMNQMQLMPQIIIPNPMMNYGEPEKKMKNDDYYDC